MLLFKDVKQNYPVWILDKENLKIVQGKVTQVSFPHTEMNRITVVDVTISADGKTATYSIPEGLCITDAGQTLVLSTEKENLVHEVEAMKNIAQQVISSIPRQKEVIKRSEELLSELSPGFKEKAEYEERFKSLETGMSDIKDMLSKFLSKKKE